MKNLEKKKTMTVIAAALAAMLGVGLATSASAQQRAARPTQAQAQTQTEGAAPSEEGVVNVNTATADELMRLPGIGPSKAAAILALRGRLAGQRFGRVEDLLRVRGIGRVTLRKLRALVALSGATTYVERTRSSRRAAAADGADGTEPSIETGDDAGE
jgi:competence protein ComEA